AFSVRSRSRSHAWTNTSARNPATETAALQSAASPPPRSRQTSVPIAAANTASRALESAHALRAPLRRPEPRRPGRVPGRGAPVRIHSDSVHHVGPGTPFPRAESRLRPDLTVQEDAPYLLAPFVTTQWSSSTCRPTPTITRRSPSRPSSSGSLRGRT